MNADTIENNSTAKQMVREFILNDHPCVMAQSLVADDNLTIKSYGSMDEGCTSKLLADLASYLQEVEDDTMKFQTFIAVFEDDVFDTEIEFEKCLWDFLYALHKKDDCEWDETTSSDPKSNNFSYSLLGDSFYIVGMHPNSSRWARSSPVPMIVFNLHSQFELLRKANRYERVRDLIRRRDKAYQGSINPMLEDFGTNSEARQYSGRAVEKNWECPYKFNSK
jgi:FPC/CPF motif-containing protein YcgG